ncbi:hypothetical protein F7725_018029 [Dissostichus mawsoni]|uniref:Uncharacterized protein n=1 Tax=Dissostichus mawsoni TaxID=36200 RepID=A0A7J5XQH1_DISMA|nr:hypothetical protein F7725_018029 [Dissostichus mawsoni]
MGPRLFLLLALTLLLFTDHSQGIPETHEKSFDVSKFSDASIFGEPLTAANPINIPRKHNIPCYCKGKGREMKSRCLCQQSGGRNGRNGKCEENILPEEEKQESEDVQTVFQTEEGREHQELRSQCPNMNNNKEVL